MNAPQTPAVTWKDAPTRTITADGVLFLIHLAAVLDNWDPRVAMEEMARDAIAFIKAMGLRQVDLFGFSPASRQARHSCSD